MTISKIPPKILLVAYIPSNLPNRPSKNSHIDKTIIKIPKIIY